RVQPLISHVLIVAEQDSHFAVTQHLTTKGDVDNIANCVVEYIVPDVVHVMMGGRIVKTGNADLAKTLEKEGYAGLRDDLTMDVKHQRCIFAASNERTPTSR
ncbi:hypothetical protein WP50_27235, partial [Lactiplantibacillus plantarum]